MALDERSRDWTLVRVLATRQLPAQIVSTAYLRRVQHMTVHSELRWKFVEPKLPAGDRREPWPPR
jgi:hypothetical protein